MRQDHAISLCPMCRMAAVSPRRRALLGLREGPMQCPACGAQYRRVAGERIKLTWANPQKIVAVGASANPMAPPAHCFRGYYLDQALPREEWERIAAGEESDAFKRWAETSARYARGDLPVIAPPDGVALQEGESAHHVTRPAWLSLSGDPIGGMELQPGTLMVTSRRLLFLTDGPPYSVAWSRVAHLTESPPAALVHELGTAEPIVLYFHPLDPAFGAMTGAWMRGGW